MSAVRKPSRRAGAAAVILDALGFGFFLGVLFVALQFAPAADEAVIAWRAGL